ncbi:C40 family peptidase [Streptosporangium sp. NPDC087985]|uniref:C40 family peptidase n=1 Tax=Streptosporangium sp. NPDC087985 TaxID=3366196 RepID=UPI003805ACBE
MSGKICPRVLTLLVAGAAALATPSLAQAAVSAPQAAPKAPASAPEAATLTGAKLKEILTHQASKPAWQKALQWAMAQRGTPYVWGGTGNGGFDCSGLMLRAYGAAGIKLPRVTYDQYAAFSKKIAWKDLRPGDLAFFSGLGHVGMISKPGYMVHAPQTGDVVKEEKLSDWRRSSFVGAVRPDAQGVKISIEQAKLAAEPAPSMLEASL